jgi:hypothetical protein
VRPSWSKNRVLLFLAARSMLGFVRWHLQRELWRRDVERLISARQRDQT